jgi:O-antigen/teichoic acid export membrane protein
MTSRKQTIGLAYLAAGGAKVFGAVVQLAVLPLAATALGAEALGLLFTVAALASFPLIAMAGFSPAASALIARSKSSGDRVGGYFWMLVLCSIIAGGVLSATTYLVVRQFGLPGGGELSLALLWLFLMSNFLAAPIDGTRAAFGESHYNSGFALVGSVITLLAVLFADDQAGTSYFFAAIYLVPVFVQLLNLGFFVVQHRSDIGRPIWDSSIRAEVTTMLATNMQAQGGMVLYLHGAVYVLATIFGTASVAVVGAFVRVGLLFQSLLLALFAPVLPTLTHAVTQGDRRWMQKGLRHLAAIALAILAGQAIATAIFGDRVAHVFFGISGQQKGALFPAIALFILCYSATHLLFLTRLAVVPRGHRGGMILLAAIIGLGLAMVFAQANIALFLALQAISMAVFATAHYGRNLWSVAYATNGDEGK